MYVLYIDIYIIYVCGHYTYILIIHIIISQAQLLTENTRSRLTPAACRGADRQETKGGPQLFPDMEMNIWKQQMHGAIGAFLSEIPATSRFSMNFESNTLEIRVHFQMAPTENAHKEPKKKAPPSKVKRNRRRLAKFLDKPETQPDSPPSTSCEKSSEGEELVAPPLFAPLEPCMEEGESLEFDTSAVADSGKDPPPSMQTKTSFTCKDREQGQGEMEKGKDGDKILVDNEAGREDEMEEKIETETEIQEPDIQDMFMKLIADFQSIKDKCEPIKDTANEFETESETETETNPTREDAQPVCTVRVPAHQISDRKFVKVERKRRKRKEQTDCKAS